MKSDEVWTNEIFDNTFVGDLITPAEMQRIVRRIQRDALRLPPNGWIVLPKALPKGFVDHLSNKIKHPFTTPEHLKTLWEWYYVELQSWPFDKLPVPEPVE